MDSARPVATTEYAAGSRRLGLALNQQLASLLQALERLPGSEAREVHGARVAARRLRSLLRTYRPLLDQRRSRLARFDLRSYARALGPVREADVRRELLLEIAREDPALPAGDMVRLIDTLDDACQASREHLHRRLEESHWRSLARALVALAPMDSLVGRGDADDRELLRLAARPWRRARRGLEHFPGTDERQHALRLKLKHCRYALEPLADLAPRRAARLARRLRTAQDAIGEHRDTLLAGHWVEANARSLGRSCVQRLGERVRLREKRLLRRARLSAAAVWPDYRKWRRAARRAAQGSGDNGGRGPG